MTIPPRRSLLRKVPSDVWLVATVALVFFLIGVAWGVPTANGPDRIHGWGVDDDTPLGPLTQMHQIVSPQPDPWLSYPLFHSFLLAAIYAPYFLFLFVTGEIGAISPTFPFGLTDPVSSFRILGLMAHVASAVMAAVTAGAATWIGRTLWDRATGLIYGGLVLSSFPLVYYARVGNVDSTAIALLFLTIVAFVGATLHGLTMGRVVLLGALAGFALATKESSVGVLLVMPVALALSLVGRQAVEPLGVRIWLWAAAGAAAAFISFGLGSGLFVAPARFFAHLAYLRDLMALVARADVGHPLAFPYTWDGHVGYVTATFSRLLEGLTPFGALLAAGGVVLAHVRRHPSRALFWMALAYLVYLFATYRLVQIRYLMPAMLILVAFAAFAIASCFRSSVVAVRIAGLMLGLAMAAQQVLVATEYTQLLLGDSRYEAGRWLAGRLGPGARLAHFGPGSTLPALDASVRTERATESFGMYWKPRWDAEKVSEIRRNWAASPPDALIVMPDYTSHGLAHSHSLPPLLYEQLSNGEAGFRLVETFEAPRWFPWLPLPQLDYAVVNPPIRFFIPAQLGRSGGEAGP